MPLRELVPGTSPAKSGAQALPKVDIVAIHGLNPKRSDNHAFKTWTKSSGRDSRLWLRDDLPVVAPNARIFIYEYNSFPAFTESKTRFVNEADTLLAHLDAERSNDPSRPLIFIAHSLGGILAKQAMVNAVNNAHYRPIKEATCGLVFFGTPHTGGNDALVKLGRISANIINTLSWSPPNDIMEAVTSGSLYADTLNESWRHQLNDYQIVSFYEGIGNIVPRESASFGLPGDREAIVCIAADHRNLCRFGIVEQADLDNYKLVRAAMERLYNAAAPARPPTNSSTAPSVAQGSQSGRADLRGASINVNDILRALLRSNTDSSESEDETTLAFPENALRDAFASGHLVKKFMPKHTLFDNFLADPLETRIPLWVKSFSHYDYTSYFQSIRQQRYPQTCEWLVQCDGIVWWCARQTSSVLWISGAPGLGKSTLLAYLSDHLCHQPESLDTGKSSTVIYSFCNEQRNRTASMVISIAIHQLLDRFPHIRRPVLNYDQSSFSEDRGRIVRGRNRSAHILWNIFRRIIQELRFDKVFLIVDALDECDPQSQIDLIRLFHEAVNGPSCIKILFSSRPYVALGKPFSYWSARAPGNFRRQKLEDQEDSINGDIDNYVQGEVARIADLKALSSEERTLIVEKLTKEGSGLFLPVTLLLRGIEDEKERSVAEIIEEMPNDLQDLYNTLLSQISSSIGSRPPSLLKYVMYCFVPLTIRELAFVSSAPRDRNRSGVFPDGFLSDTHLARIRSDVHLLGTMLRVRADDDTVTFIHISAKQFLITRSLDDSGNEFLFKPWQAHRDIAVECLRLVILNSNLCYPTPWSSGWVNSEREQVFSTHALLRYALNYWSRHLKAAVDGMPAEKAVDGELMALVSSFAQVWKTSSSGFRWIVLSYSGMDGLSEYASNHTSVIELLSILGLTVFLEVLLQRTHQGYRHITPTVQSALLLAIRGGHESTVDVLINHFNITSLEDDAYKKVVEDSAWSRHPSLLQKITKLRKPRVDELLRASTAAFTTGEQNTLNIITQDRSIFQDRDQFGRTALHSFFIVYHGDQNMASGQVLTQALYYVKNGVDINAQDIFGFTALHYACWSRELCTKDLIDGLVRHGADPTSTTIGGLTPFYFAVRYAKHPDAIETMLKISSYQLVGTKSRGENTPLHWAVQRGCNFREDEQIFRTLIRGGADPHVRNRRGFSAIQYARGGDCAGYIQATYSQIDGIDTYAVLLGLPSDFDANTDYDPEEPSRNPLRLMEAAVTGDFQDSEAGLTSRKPSLLMPALYKRNLLSIRELDGDSDGSVADTNVIRSLGPVTAAESSTLARPKEPEQVQEPGRLQELGRWQKPRNRRRDFWQRWTISRFSRT